MLAIYLSMLETQEEKDLFEKIYLECRQAMYYKAYDVLNNVEDAEDAVHMSFLKIADNLTKISSMPCQEIRRYVVIICKNTAINIYNANKKEAENVTSLNECNDIDVGCFENEDKTYIMDAIGKLPKESQDILYLNIVQGFQAKEISKMLDISADAVWQRVSRAKKQLREILQRGN